MSDKYKDYDVDDNFESFQKINKKRKFDDGTNRKKEDNKKKNKVKKKNKS